MNYQTPLKILFYAVLFISNICMIDQSFEWIREADTFLNVFGFFVLLQLAILDYLLINFFNNKIKQIKNENN